MFYAYRIYVLGAADFRWRSVSIVIVLMSLSSYVSELSHIPDMSYRSVRLSGKTLIVRINSPAFAGMRAGDSLPRVRALPTSSFSSHSLSCASRTRYVLAPTLQHHSLS